MQQILILNGLTKISLKIFQLLLIATNYSHKISEFKYVDIKDLINKIKHNTISEISAKEGLYVLKQTKNAEIIKYKKRTPGQKESLNLFIDFSDTILTDETLE